MVAAFKYLRQTARDGGDGFRLPLCSIFEEFLKIADLLKNNQERIDDAAAFSQILDDYDEIYRDYQLTARISGLLYFLEERALEEYKYHNFKADRTAENAVQVMTVHKSKGLEFETVFLPNMMEREFPSLNKGGRKYWHILGGTFEENKDKYESEVDDERKLFYVAVTRAKENLLFFYDLTKKDVSTFIKEAAESSHLDIDRDDLMSSEEINELRKQLLDEVVAMHRAGLKGPILDYDRIKNASLAELRTISSQYGFM